MNMVVEKMQHIFSERFYLWVCFIHFDHLSIFDCNQSWSPTVKKKSALLTFLKISCLFTFLFIFFSGSSLEEILAAARDQPDSVEQSALVEDVDSDETSSDASESEEKLTRDEPLVTLEAGKSAEVDSDSGKDCF